MKYQREKIELVPVWSGDKSAWHGGMLNAIPEVNQPPPKVELVGRPIGREYVSDQNALASGHFPKDGDE